MKKQRRTERRAFLPNNSKAHKDMLPLYILSLGNRVFTVVSSTVNCSNLFTREFLQRYSLMSAAIKEVPPGEEVFNLEKFGQIFDQNTLQLRQCLVNPQGTAQKTLLW